MLLVSAGADLGSSHWSPESSLVTNAPADYLAPFFVTGDVIRGYLGTITPGEAEVNPWLSPSSKYVPDRRGLFTGFPPTFLVAGGAEMLLDSIRTLRDRMVEDMGSDCTYLEVPDAMHIFLSLGAWHEPEASQTYRKVAEWLSGVMHGRTADHGPCIRLFVIPSY